MSSIKYNFCPECGSKTAISGANPPKFCASCGYSFYKSPQPSIKAQKTPKYIEVDNDDDNDDDDMNPSDGGGFSYNLKASDVKVEFSKNRVKIGDLSAMPESEGRDLPATNLTDEQFKKQWISDAGIARRSVDVSEGLGD